ncbi:MAG: helix-turn-helix transcriptional regulator [Bacillota bacterium]|nr:helix-turn-helix transcriptional regulator [Bacillota bacterium]
MNCIFANKLKQYRKELELKRHEKVGQVKLAEELGISKGTIGNLESSKRLPSKSLLIKLAAHSGKSLDYWTDGIGEYEAPNSVDLVLDEMISEGIITDADSVSEEAWQIIKDAVLLEIKRKLD